jgi:hypothetical protein
MITLRVSDLCTIALQRLRIPTPPQSGTPPTATLRHRTSIREATRATAHTIAATWCPLTPARGRLCEGISCSG